MIGHIILFKHLTQKKHVLVEQGRSKTRPLRDSNSHVLRQNESDLSSRMYLKVSASFRFRHKSVGIGSLRGSGCLRTGWVDLGGMERSAVGQTGRGQKALGLFDL